MASQTCPQCDKTQKEVQTNFCTACGTPLLQPCPNCHQTLASPKEPFLSCSGCQHDFWSCRACTRLYHLDRTSCANTYCPAKGQFWTSRFGKDPFTGSQLVFPEMTFSRETPQPAWLEGPNDGSDKRWPSFHVDGLLISVQESGIVELWAERGAPHLTAVDEFQERSVCLSKLDLGEPAGLKPFEWKGRYVLPGTSSVSLLEMSSTPSLGQAYQLENLGKLLGAVPLANQLFFWGTEACGTLETELGLTTLESPMSGEASQNALLLTDGADKVLQIWGAEPVARVYSLKEGFKELGPLGLPGKLDYGLHTPEGFVMLVGNRLAFLGDDGKVQVNQLPASVVSEPLYSEEDNRLILLLNDGSARSCSCQGDKLSFVSELAGVPSTRALKLGEHLFYGSDGRYLCRDSEAIRPRLPAAPSGALSYANGRIFGTLRDGSLFSFQV